VKEGPCKGILGNTISSKASGSCLLAASTSAASDAFKLTATATFTPTVLASFMTTPTGASVLFVPSDLRLAHRLGDLAFSHASGECIAAAKDVFERTADNSLKTEDLCLGDGDSLTKCRDFRRFSRQVSGVYDTSFQSLFVFVCVLRGKSLLIQLLRDS
jgi:hypothetical protein